MVLKRLKKLKNTWVYKASDRSKKGIPDIVMCVDGTFVAMELKRSEKEKATPLQKHTLQEIAEAKGYGWEVNPENWDDTWDLLIEIAGGTND
jgi:hypothetical protein